MEYAYLDLMLLNGILLILLHRWQGEREGEQREGGRGRGRGREREGEREGERERLKGMLLF